MEVDNIDHTQGEDPQELINELGRLLGKAEVQPSNIRLLRRQVSLMLQLNLISEAIDAVKTLSKLSMLGEELWMSYVAVTVPKTFEPNTMVDVQLILEEIGKDYISAPVLVSLMHSVLNGTSGNTILDGGEDAIEGEGVASSSATKIHIMEPFSSEDIRIVAKNISDRAHCLLSESHLVWQPWMDWEMGLLSRCEDLQERTEQIARINDMYLQRLQVPHSLHSSTSSAYSSFCSEFLPDGEYMGRMTTATELSQSAKWQLSEEKRRKSSRDVFEDGIANSNDIGQQLQLYTSYIDWETDPVAKKATGKRKGPRQDYALTCAVFERAIALYAKAATLAETSLLPVRDTSNQDGDSSSSLQTQEAFAKDTYAAYKAAEATLWTRYLDWVIQNGDVDEKALSVLHERSTRACWGSGELWSRRLNIMESGVTDITSIDTVVEQAKGLLRDNEQPVGSLVELLLAHATLNHRIYREVEPAVDSGIVIHPVFDILSNAIKEVFDVDKGGDPSIKLEKFFVAWAESTLTEGILPIVLDALQPSSVQPRLSSYQIVILRAEAQARYGDIDSSRATYISAIHQKDLDWPEAVYEAYTLFENVHGTLETTIDARRNIDREQQKLMRRRQKAALDQRTALNEEHKLYTEAQPEAAQEAPQADNVSELPLTSGALQSKASNLDSNSEEHHLKRDRENTTILVTGLKSGTDSSRVTSFFEDCGKVRECSVLPGSDSDAALVEFRMVEAIPAALSKDRKNLDGSEIHVTMLWRSTLFVTNFSKETDDAALRTLFSQYGSILQTRWPSRKYADSRRFCYITMASPAAAQSALILHNFQAGEGFPLTVLISDPSAKVKRTDASNSTLFIGGLNPKTTEGDVRSLLEEYGSILGIKLGWDPVKRICKGFAFVEMGTEAEANKCLVTNGTQYHGRFLKVEISDPNHANKRTNDGKKTAGSFGAREAAERRARQVRLNDLPEGTQEGLLQQELEKIVPVVRLEIFATSQQALVELETPADAGTLLMRPEPFMFNGATIRIGDQSEHRNNLASRPEKAAPSSSLSASAPQSSLAMKPRPPRKQAKVLGKSWQPPKATKESEPLVSKPDSSMGQDDFRAFMTAKNEQRKNNLTGKIESTAGNKHAIEDDAAAVATPAKRHKIDDAK